MIVTDNKSANNHVCTELDISGCQQPKISVIIPVYNVEKYLDRCLESVVNQTYKNLEIILVDDGSTDSSGKKCDEYAINDSRIKVLHKSNGGLSDARNVAISICKGEYITFVDSDDWICTNLIEHLYNNLIIAEADVSIGLFQRVYDDVAIKRQHNDISICEYSGKEAIRQMYGVCSFSAHAWGKLYKRHFFNEIHYPKGKIYEDEFTTYKILWAASKVVVTNEKLYFYYIRSDSLSHERFNENQLDRLTACDEMLCYFEKCFKDIIPILKYRWLDAYIVFCRDAARANTSCERLEKEFNKALLYSKGYLTCKYVDKRFKLCWAMIRMNKRLFSKFVRIFRL